MGAPDLSEGAEFQGQLNVPGSAKAARSDIAPEVATLNAQALDLESGAQRGCVAPVVLPAEVVVKHLKFFKKMKEGTDFAPEMVAMANPVALKVGAGFKARNADTRVLPCRVGKPAAVGHDRGRAA